MHHTSSVATSLQRMASAALMLLQKLRGKMGGCKDIFPPVCKHLVTNEISALYSMFVYSCEHFANSDNDQ